MMEDKQKELDRQETYRQYGLDSKKIPQHVAIVMDGNGRWARKRFLPRTAGHKAGSEALRTIIKTSVELNIKYLTVYVFSTENWKRSQIEVDFLMNLLKTLIIREIPTLNKNGARVRFLGALGDLPKDVQKNISIAEKETAHNQILNLNLMVNYGGRREMIDAVAKFLEQSKGEKQELTEEVFNECLYTRGMPDPDILVRTGGDVRISNYLLWQIAYSELFFLDTLWPDFGREELIQIVQQFQKRDRRFGGVK